MKLSVVIPVYRDYARLKKCLESLEHQSLPRSRYEIIVVVNDAARSPQLQMLQGQFTAVRWTFCSSPGSYRARNVGIYLARGEVVAFTDSDCVPCHDWLEQGLRHFDGQTLDAVAGDIEIFSHRTVPSIVDLYEHVFAFCPRLFVSRYHYGPTANLFVRKKIFSYCGKFDSVLYSGGDLEWGQRLKRMGGVMGFSSAAKVLHPAREGMIQLLRQRIRIRSGLELLRLRGGDNWEEPLCWSNLFLPLDQLRRWVARWDYFDRLPMPKQRSVINLFYTLRLIEWLLVSVFNLHYQIKRFAVRIDRVKL